MTDRGNWGRWGVDDERGAVNLLTPDVVVSALSAARDGRVLALGLPIRGSTSGPAAQRVPHLAGRPLPQHFMSVDGGDYAVGARRVKGALAVCDDTLIVSAHGTTTHIDALAHMWRDDVLYNGHPAARVRSYGATRCGIDKAGPIVARGVLLDAAKRAGVDHLPGDARIGASLLQEMTETAGIEIEAGDVVLVRTGWPTVFEHDPAGYQDQQPGLAHDGAQWLVDRGVVAVGSDNSAVGAMDPGGVFAGTVDEDVHLVTLWEHGVHLIEMLWLEELSGALPSDRATFLFIAAPLAIEGGTASPLNPVAVL
jgi:kynurenine formamidase